VHLTITDHLEWEPGKKEELKHIWLLQEKINAYLRFLESGEIFERFPQARGGKQVINVVGKYPLSELATTFYKKVRGVIEAAGFELRFEHSP
jgi:hypothetical protein